MLVPREARFRQWWILKTCFRADSVVVSIGCGQPVFMATPRRGSFLVAKNEVRTLTLVLELITLRQQLAVL